MLKFRFSFSSLLIGFILALTCIAGLYFAGEYKARKFLIHAGIISDNGIINTNPYGRVIDLYSVSANTPNYKFSGYDENFRRGAVMSDSNGFIISDTDGFSLSKQKTPGTIRIFLVGGSSAFGSIQNRNSIPDSSYPEGTYTYSASICGMLKTILSARYPGVKFEVVNAAVVLHQFHQGYTMYLEKIHDFHPDIVINFDLQNDIGVFDDFAGSGDPYTSLEQVSEELNIEMLRRCPRSPYLSLWWNASHLYKFENQKNGGKINPVSRDTTPLKFDQDDRNYQLIAPYIIRNMQKMLWLINGYERQLQDDTVLSVFCIQPLLLRDKAQKALSPLEQKLKSAVKKNQETIVTTVADSIAIQPLLASYYKILPSDIVTVLDRMGNNKFKISDYSFKVINEYFSPTVDSVVRSHHGIFIDMGKQMVNLSAGHEFYVDYCHMTPFGNQFVAGKIADAVAPFLKHQALQLSPK